MNKKTVVLIVAFVGCLVPSFVKAQEIKVTKSPEILKGDELTVDFVIAGQAANSIYAYRRLEKGIELYKFDKTTLKLADKKEISFKLREDATKTRTPDLNKVLVLKDHIIVFTDLYYKGDNESSLYGRRFDFNLNPVKEWQKIEFINTEISAHPGMFLISASPDSSKILIVKTETLTNNKGNEKISFTVINPKLSWMSSKDEELKYADTRTNVAGYKISNDGVVYMLVKVDEDKESVYKLYRFILNNANEFVTSEYDLKLPGKKTVDITCELSDAGDLLVAGFYSNTDAEKIQGIFSARVANGATAVSPVYSELADFPNVKLSIDKLNIQSETAFELLAEERYQVAAAGGGVYHTNSLHYFRITGGSAVTNYYTVFKQAKADKTPESAFLSVFSLTGSYSPIVFYNENSKNLLEGEKYNEITAEQKDNKRVLAYATFVGDKTNRVGLLKEGDERVGFIPRYAVQISATEMLMLGKRNESYVLYRVTVTGKEQLEAGIK